MKYATLWYSSLLAEIALARGELRVATRRRHGEEQTSRPQAEDAGGSWGISASGKRDFDG